MHKKKLLLSIAFISFTALAVSGLDPSVLYHLSEEGNDKKTESQPVSPRNSAEDDDEDETNHSPRPLAHKKAQENPTAAHAQTRLGHENELRYKDYKEAVKWYRKAADQGYAEAQYRLANCYERGLGVPADLRLAFELFRKSAEQEYAPAQYRLAICYEIGSGVKDDRKVAVKWHRKAAEQGYAEAQLSLGACYSLGMGVEPDLKAAAEWYRKAAEQGNLKGQVWYADCCMEGKGVPQNQEEALKWYRKAAAQGDGNAKLKVKMLSASSTSTAK